jgi:hypothetical protein
MQGPDMPARRFGLLDHPPYRNGGHDDIPTWPGLGIGEFRPDAAAEHPFDPQAFRPIWTGNWRRNF